MDVRFQAHVGHGSSSQSPRWVCVSSSNNNRKQIKFVREVVCPPTTTTSPGGGGQMDVRCQGHVGMPACLHAQL